MQFVIAWSDAAAGSIIEFSFVPFATEGRSAAACEKIVLDGLQTWWDGIRTHPWGQMDDREGTGWVPLFDPADIVGMRDRRRKTAS